MKYCTHCGAEIDENAEICRNCGCRVEGAKAATNQTDNSSKSDDVLGKAAKVFMILSIVAIVLGALFNLIIAGGVNLLNGTNEFTEEELGMAQTMYIILAVCELIALAWVIPMTISVSRRVKNCEPIGTGFKVCVLIFVNIISGILLLCRKEPSKLEG